MFSCIIVDDEKMARLLLRNMIGDIDANIQVLAECADLASAVKSIRQLKPEVVFLDIEMPGASGIEIMNFFDDDEIDFEVVFTTGYSEYALQAFRLAALDYLLKPINPNELANTIGRIKKGRQQMSTSYRALYENLALGKDVGEKCMLINLATSTKFVKLRDIVMLHAEGAYTTFYLKGGERLMASKNLKLFEDRLVNCSNFFRSHKSYIVNLNCVREYNRGAGVLELEGKLEASISGDKYELFLNKMEALI